MYEDCIEKFNCNRYPNGCSVYCYRALGQHESNANPNCYQIKTCCPETVTVFPQDRIYEGLPGRDGKDGSSLEFAWEGTRLKVRLKGTEEWVYSTSLLGMAGPQGLKGEKGERGPKGDTGMRGAQGPIGPMGMQGPQGIPGPRGATGPQGPRGERGPKGIQGIQGERGFKGDTGDVGPQGPQGPQGEQGLIGPAGYTPYIGDNGNWFINGQDLGVAAGGGGSGIGKSGTGGNSEIFNDYENNIASGDYSHAEGNSTIASEYAAHAEGCATEASATYSHAEGFYTVANGVSQHVQGEYNIIDTQGSGNQTKGKYAHIVGNGTYSNRSNAHTIDWNGLGWFKGGLKIGGTGQDDTDAKEVATKEYVDSGANKIKVNTGLSGDSENPILYSHTNGAIVPINGSVSHLSINPGAQTLKIFGKEVSTKEYVNNIVASFSNAGAKIYTLEAQSKNTTDLGVELLPIVSEMYQDYLNNKISFLYLLYATDTSYSDLYCAQGVNSYTGNFTLGGLMQRIFPEIYVSDPSFTSVKLETPAIFGTITDGEITKARVSFVHKGGGFNGLATDEDYTTPYEPLYPGSPATKKYVDDHGIKVLEASTDNVIDFNTLTKTGKYLIKNCNGNTTLNGLYTNTAGYSMDIFMEVIIRNNNGAIDSITQSVAFGAWTTLHVRSYNPNTDTWGAWYNKISASSIDEGKFSGKMVANATAVATLTNSQVRNITASTTDLTAGTSALATGDIYLVYE